MGSAQEWVSHVSRHVNFKQLSTKAAEPVALAVTGTNRDDFVGALRAAGQERPGSILVADTPHDVQPQSNTIVKAIVYCPSSDSPNGSRAQPESLPCKVYIVGTGESHDGNAVNTFDLAVLRKHVLPNIVRAYRSHETALAAAIPAFRPVVAAKLTNDCAMTCLKIAAASALADHVPVLGLLTGGIASAGDTIAITALQMRMLLRIAVAYGHKPEFARVLELLPVIGGGYGWRTLAREASGFIPIAGIPIKAAIAYAGTLVVGQVATYYYETGLRMSSGAIRARYREASEHAKDFARRFIPARAKDKHL